MLGGQFSIHVYIGCVTEKWTSHWPAEKELYHGLCEYTKIIIII